MGENFTALMTAAEEYDLRQKEAQSIVESMDENTSIYCSFVADNDDDRKRLYNAVSTDGMPLIENTGKPIQLTDVAVQAVEIENDDGTSSVVPRISILTLNGDIYTATSWGLYRALQRINNLYGTLHFEEGLTIEAVRVKTKKGQTINLKIV